MKKILIILLLIALKGQSQTPINYTKINQRYDWLSGKFDSTLHVPFGSSPSIRGGGYNWPGAVFLDTLGVDSGLYYFNRGWVQVGKLYLAGTGLTLTTNTFKVDTVPIATRLRVQKGIDSLGAVKEGVLGWYRPEDYGADGDGTSDDGPEFQAMIDAMPSRGGIVYLNNKTYAINTTVTVTDKTVKFLSSGNKSTELTTTSATINMFLIKGDFVEFNGVKIINTAATPTAGSAIKVDTRGDGQPASFTRIFNCDIRNFYDNINFQSAQLWTIDHSFISGSVRYGIDVKDVAFPDAGDQAISNTQIWANVRSSVALIHQSSAGGLKVTNTKFNGDANGIKADYCYWGEWDGNLSAILSFSNCSFENFGISAIEFDQINGDFPNVQITGCQFASYHGDKDYYIDIDGCDYVSITGNTFSVTVAEKAIRLSNGSNATLANVYPDPSSSAYVTLTAFTNVTDLNNISVGSSQWTTSGSDIYYNTGTVGIGTAVGVYDLEINKTRSTPTTLGIWNAGTGADSRAYIVAGEGSGKYLDFGYFNASYTTSGIFAASTSLLRGISTGGLNIGATDAVGVIRFFTGGNATGNERARIDADGRLGVGTIAPLDKIDVVTSGSAGLGGRISITNSAAGTTGNTAELGFRMSSGFQGGGTYYSSRIVNQQTAAGNIGALSFYLFNPPTGEPEGLKRMQISSDGNVLLNAYSGTGNRLTNFDATGNLVRSTVDPALVSVSGHTHAQSDVTNLTADLALKAPLASPTFTGTPAAPTAAGGTNTTQIATTAFVTTAVSNATLSGSYTPTLFNTTNVAASTAYTCYWYRVNDMVYVFGEVDIDPTTTLTATELGFSLPTGTNASNLADDGELSGTAASAIAAEAIAILGDVTNDRASIKYLCTDISNHTLRIHFSYKVTPP